MQASGSSINYDIDEYDERFLRHLAPGRMIANLKGMPLSKITRKRQNDLVGRLFPNGDG